MLAEHLEKDVADIDRMDVVHCYQMALKRLRNLMDLVEAEGSEEQKTVRLSSGGEGSSSASGSGSGAPGSSSSNPMVL